MTFALDSVLVEKVAKATYEVTYPSDHWEAVSEEWANLWRRQASALLSVACPLVAGVIADRLDEEAQDEFLWAPRTMIGLRVAAEFVRFEYVDGEA